LNEKKKRIKESNYKKHRIPNKDVERRDGHKEREDREVGGDGR